MAKRLFVLTLLVPFFASAGVFNEDSLVEIPIAPADTLPATDLMIDGKRLNVLEAQQRQKKEKLDLSRIEPSRESEYYDGQDHSSDRALDQAVGVDSGDGVVYVDTLASAEGRVRFNARTKSGKLYNFLLSPTLHTLLLRKEFLRKLGYKVPAMKWLPQVEIYFPDLEAKKVFYGSIVNSTNFAPSRWEVPETGGDPHRVTFQDVVVMEAGASNNLAFGPPLETEPEPRDPKSLRLLPLRERIFRALSIPYGISDLKKSVNQLDWSMAGTQGDKIVFNVSVVAKFNTGMDDALWILRKVGKLTRDEIKTIVDGAYFPEPIADLMVEKIIARTKSLYALPGLKQVPTDLEEEAKQQGTTYTVLKPDLKISSGPHVVDGKVRTDEWPGHVTPFKTGDQPSPLKGIKYFILSQLQNGVVQGLLNLANKEIPSLTLDGAFKKHQDELFQKALIEWQQTGQVQAPSFKVWTAPLANGGVSLSRGPVIGNYLGTNNMVSLADSFGVSLNVGLALNTDGAPQYTQFSGLVQGSISLNLTHVKQLVGFKQIVKEPIQNEFVPYVLFRSSKFFKRISERKDSAASIPKEQLEKELYEDFEKIRTMIGVGDSLILSLNLSGLEQVTAGVGLPKSVGPNASLGLAANQAAIWRVHFHRKDETTLQVFKDNGHLNAFDISFNGGIAQPAQFPVVNINFKTTKGKAKTKMFTMNIAKNPVENPKLYETAAAISIALKTGSLSAIEDLARPVTIRNDFKDNSSGKRTLHHVNRKLKTRTEMDITLPDQTHGKYLALNFGRQRGHDFQKVATDAANFLIQLLTNQVQWNLSAFTSNAPNPGNTFYGSSYTRNANFQAQLAPGIKYPFVKITHTWQGFQKSAEKTRELIDELNTKYQHTFYSDEALRHFKNIQLYQIGISINIYEDGLRTVSALTKGQVNLLLYKYRNKHDCFLGLSVPCAAIRRFENAYHRVHRTRISEVKKGAALFTLAQSLEEFADFQDFLSLMGGERNILIAPRISGFWTESEIKAIEPPLGITFGYGSSPFSEGIVRSVEEILNVDDGEFYAQWLREVL